VVARAVLEDDGGRHRQDEGRHPGGARGNLGAKKIFIAGSDADASNINSVCEGKQTIEVLKDIKPLAEKAAEVALALSQNKPIEGATGKPPTIAIGVHLVTKDNAKAMIVDSGFHPAKAVPACK
jgi:D-xylose transport system substrate-binding protein